MPKNWAKDAKTTIQMQHPISGQQKQKFISILNMEERQKESSA